MTYVFFFFLIFFLGTSMEGGMPGPSHGNNELNQEQQGESYDLYSFW